MALFSPKEILVKKVNRVLEENGPAKGHIFNLGHGILPETPVEAVGRVIDQVHSQTKQNT